MSKTKEKCTGKITKSVINQHKRYRSTALEQERHQIKMKNNMWCVEDRANVQQLLTVQSRALSLQKPIMKFIWEL